MSWEVLAILMFGGLLLLLAVGIPVAFGLGFIGLIGAFLVWGTQAACYGAGYKAGETAGKTALEIGEVKINADQVKLLRKDFLNHGDFGLKHFEPLLPSFVNTITYSQTKNQTIRLEIKYRSPQMS